MTLIDHLYPPPSYAQARELSGSESQFLTGTPITVHFCRKQHQIEEEPTKPEPGTANIQQTQSQTGSVKSVEDSFDSRRSSHSSNALEFPDVQCVQCMMRADSISLVSQRSLSSVEDPPSDDQNPSCNSDQSTNNAFSIRSSSIYYEQNERYSDTAVDAEDSISSKASSSKYNENSEATTKNHEKQERLAENFH